MTVISGQSNKTYLRGSTGRERRSAIGQALGLGLNYPGIWIRRTVKRLGTLKLCELDHGKMVYVDDIECSRGKIAETGDGDSTLFFSSLLSFYFRLSFFFGPPLFLN